MKNLLALLVVILVGLVSCKNNEKPVESLGMSVSELNKSIDTLVGKEVTVWGMVDHVCKHGGTKMVIFDTITEESIHIEAGESGNFRADEVMGEIVSATGIVEEFVVDDAYILTKEAELTEMMATGEGKAVENVEAKKGEGEHHGEGAPDEDGKHKQDVEGLQKQIDDLKAQLAEAKAAGKAHLSFYSVKCKTYKVVTDNVQGVPEEVETPDTTAQAVEEPVKEEPKKTAPKKETPKETAATKVVKDMKEATVEKVDAGAKGTPANKETKTMKDMKLNKDMKVTKQEGGK